LEYSSIDYVKEVAEKSFGWDKKKDVKGRNLLAAIKQLMIGYNDLPLQKVADVLIDSIVFDVDILVVDIREPDEIEKLVNHCKKVSIPCYTCRIHNTKAEDIVKKGGHSLTGDRLYGQYDYDLNITNNGSLEELAIQVNTVFAFLLGKDEHSLSSIGRIIKEKENEK
jgi:hypothetical protein